MLGDRRQSGERFPVTRRTDLFLVAMAGLAAAAMLCPAVAGADTQCQSTPTTAVGAVTEDAAIAEWSAEVKKSLGAAWSNYAMAKSPQVNEQNAALSNLFFITAYPCRTITPAATIIAKPNAAIERH
jgi:hypothetical protein